MIQRVVAFYIRSDGEHYPRTTILYSPDLADCGFRPRLESSFSDDFCSARAFDFPRGLLRSFRREQFTLKTVRRKGLTACTRPRTFVNSERATQQ